MATTVFRAAVNLSSSCRSMFNSRLRPATVTQLHRHKSVKQDVSERLRVLDIPEKPKRPLTTYLRFIQDHRRIVLKQEPDLKATDVMKRCAADWRSLDATVKEKYELDYRADLDAYAKKFEVYSMSLSPEQREALKSCNDEIKNAKIKRQLKKQNKEMNKPKRPIGAYMMYVMDQAKKQPDKSFKQLLADLKGCWHSLPESERTKYTSIANREHERYNRQLEAWEQTMLKEGNENLVRVSTLSEFRPTLDGRKRANKSSTNKKPTDGGGGEHE